MIVFISSLMTVLGFVVWLFYRAKKIGKKQAEHDYEASLNRILREDAQDWADRPRTDDDFTHQLLDIAARKRQDRS